MSNESSLADLTAAVQRMTAVIEQSSAATERRLGALEERLETLEGSGAAARALRKVRETEGAGAVDERLEELFTRLADAETLESLARVAVLVPKLEYALQAIASGPELLEEGLSEVRRRGGKERLGAAIEAASSFTEPAALPALARMAARAPALETSVEAAARAARELEAVHGKSAIGAGVAELARALGDPETLEVLARLVALAPKLEYAAHAVAAGPELLEEGLEAVRARTSGAPDARLHAAIDAAAAVSDPATLTKLGRVAVAAADLEAPVRAVAAASADLARAHGESAVRDELSALLVTIGDPETLATLTRVVALVPRLEYAVQAIAAGPELLEEALGVIAERTRGGAPVDARLRAALDAIGTIAEPATLGKLASLARSAAALEPVVVAGASAVERTSLVIDRGALDERVGDLVVALSDGETLEALARTVQLIPRLEYALQALAAGPELLEEGLAAVRAWSLRALGDANAVDRRIATALDALVGITQPAVLVLLSKTLPDLLAAPGIADALRTLGERAGELGPAVDRLSRAWDKALARERLDAAALDARLDGALRLGLEATRPEKLEALTRVTDLLVKVASPEKLDALERASALLVKVSSPEKLDALERLSDLALVATAALADRDDDALKETLATLTRTETLEAVRDATESLPQLARTLAALPVQPHTLELLRTLNEAVESASRGSDPVGAWGLWRALGDPDVRATVGIGIDVARRLGAQLGASKARPRLKG